MNFDHELFGDDGRFLCDDPMEDPIAYDGQQLVEGYDDDMAMPYVDNSLVVPMDENYESYNNGMQSDSREFQTLQAPVPSAYDMDMGHSQSSMGMGGYSNGATNEALMYEQSATLSNGDHRMMGGNEDHYGMPSTSFGGYQPSPMADHQPSPSVSRQHSRPASRSTAPKGGGGGGGAIAQHLNAPSSSSYSNSPTPSAKPTPAKKSNPQRPANGSRTKKAQGANTVGAVLSKANKLAANPPATNTLQLSAEDTNRVAQLSMEIARLEKEGTLHARARVDELTKQRAQIFVLALTAQQNVNVDLKALTPSVTTHAPRQRTSQKKQQSQPQLPSSPGYTPQCGSMYTPTGHDGYAAVPGPSHGGYMATPSGPQSMHQRGTMYKVTSAGPPHAGPRGLNGAAAAGGGGGMGQAPPLFLQQQQHGQPPPQMVMTSSTTATPTTTTPSSTMMMGRRVGGAGSRTMMVRGGGVPQSLQQPLPVQQLQQPPLQQTHPGLAQHPPGTTVRAALKQGGLQHLQQLNHQQQQPPLHLQQGPMQHPQQHRSSPMPSTSTAQQPQPLLQLSLPVQQQPQPIRMEDPFRPNPQLVARRIEEKRQGRQRKLQNAFEIMSTQLLHPETELPFSGVDDIFKRLMPYHLLFEHDLDPQLEEEFDLQFMRAMVEADEGKRRITERMRKIAIDEAIARKDEERNLLLFLDAEFEKQRLEEERKMAREQPESLQPIVRATALALSAATPLLPPPSDRLKELKKPEEMSNFSLYEYHPFVERRRIPTPPPIGKFYGLDESEEEEESEDEEQAESAAAAAAAAGPSSSSAIKPSPSTDDEASPEMGWPADDLPQQAPPPPTVPHHHRPATVPSHHPLTTHDRMVKVEVASPRPAAAAGKVQPTQPIKQEVASPARTKPTVSSRATVHKYEMPEAIPVPQATRNRMMEDRMKEEERRKKVEERERKEAEERRRKEDERKERERRKKEEERVKTEENKRREEEERRLKEKEKEEMERREREREEMEKRRREEEEGEKKKVMMPIKLKIKMAAREEEKKDEEKIGEEESENREKKSKKKRKKEKREREENDEEERERKKRKKEKKERERQAAAAQEAAAEAVVQAAAAAPAAATTTTTPAIPKLKIKFGGATPAATPSAAAVVASRDPVLPASVPPPAPIVRASAAAAPPSTPVQHLQQPQQQSPAPPPSVKLKIRIGGPPAVAAAAAATPSPSAKEERRREKEERRKENGHHKEKHHHKHKEHNHKEHKSEKRHREQQQQSQSQPAAAAPAAPQPQPQASSQPTVPSFKINMTLQRPAPVALPTTPVSAAAAATMQQQLKNVQQVQQMTMNTPPQLFRPSVIAAPPQLQMQQLQQNALAAAMGLQQPPPMPLTPVIPPAAPPLIPGLGRLPPGPEEQSPPRVDFSDSEDEDVQRSNSMHESAAAITRMVGLAPTLLPPHHHRLPQLQQSMIQPAFPWNNQYQ